MAKRVAPQRVLKVGPSADAVRSSLVARRANAEQSDLFSDPFPERIEPCLALLAQKPPAAEAWSFEVKWDGYRLAVHRDADRVRILTRGGHDWASRFPGIVEAARALPARKFVMDGEGVVLDDQGRSSFNQLQRELGGRGGKSSSASVILYAFDLLYLDGHDLRGMALSERRSMLDALVGGLTGAIRLSEDVDADGAAFFRAACKHELEGIIAKRKDAPYRSGRGGDWLKIKCVQSDSFAIIGYEPSAAALGGIARIILAAKAANGLAEVGSVGTGFTEAGGRVLRRRLEDLRVEAPVASARRKGVVWTRPELVAEVAYRGWTGDMKLRHASYKGLREAEDELAVFQLGSEGP
ncbi:MAG: ATP-dependent DNA ligase [Stutzerimonas stutzeri]|nr:MAG: ATP-dependent DNA ligase [Stutzerimonas stutzeri]